MCEGRAPKGTLHLSRCPLTRDIAIASRIVVISNVSIACFHKEQGMDVSPYRHRCTFG